MSRKPRQMSNSGIYHVMLRGNEKKDIFLESSEKRRFLEGLEVKQKEMGFSLYAYCLMNNHAHLLMNMNNEEISLVMSGITVRYAAYYNLKHNRVGHVFQDRFRSEAVEDDHYLLAAVRYIHNNPVKAGLVEKPQDYFWSSYQRYIKRNAPALLDTDFVLSMFSQDITEAVKEFENFSMLIDESIFIDLDEEIKIRTLEEGHSFLQAYLLQKHLSIDINQIKNDIELRNEIIQHLKTHTVLSQRAIADLLGIHKSAVERYS